jgi:hypothetical protein
MRLTEERAPLPSPHPHRKGNGMTDTHTHRELAHRSGGGIAVTLYWNAEDDSTSVEIFHAATEQTLHFAVPRDHALDAFYHPFAHMQTWSEGAVLSVA